MGHVYAGGLLGQLHHNIGIGLIAPWHCFDTFEKVEVASHFRCHDISCSLKSSCAINETFIILLFKVDEILDGISHHAHLMLVFLAVKGMNCCGIQQLHWISMDHGLKVHPCLCFIFMTLPHLSLRNA